MEPISRSSGRVFRVSVKNTTVFMQAPELSLGLLFMPSSSSGCDASRVCVSVVSAAAVCSVVVVARRAGDTQQLDLI